MQQTGLFWLPVEEAGRGLDGLLGDLQLSLPSGTPCGLQVTRIAAAFALSQCSPWSPAESGQKKSWIFLCCCWMNATKHPSSSDQKCPLSSNFCLHSCFLDHLWTVVGKARVFLELKWCTGGHRHTSGEAGEGACVLQGWVLGCGVAGVQGGDVRRAAAGAIRWQCARVRALLVRPARDAATVLRGDKLEVILLNLYLLGLFQLVSPSGFSTATGNEWILFLKSQEWKLVLVNQTLGENCTFLT